MQTENERQRRGQGGAQSPCRHELTRPTREADHAVDLLELVEIRGLKKILIEDCEPELRQLEHHQERGQNQRNRTL